MSYDKLRALKGSGASVRTQTREGPEIVVDWILKTVEEIKDWKDAAATEPLKTKITKAAAFGRGGDKALLQLIKHTKSTSDNWDGSIWARSSGRSLLYWMLEDTSLRKLFVEKPQKSRGEGEDELSGRLPVHYAIENSNYGFLITFLGICYDFKSDSKRLERKPENLDSILACSENSSKDNCVHLAVKKFLHFTSFMVEVCSAKALTDKDSEGYTPLHRAMTKVKGAMFEIPPALRFRLKALPEKSRFDPPNILETIQQRRDADMVFQKILIATNTNGISLYQEGLDRWDSNREQGQGEFGFEESVKSLIFQKVQGIQNVSIALYGNSGDGKFVILHEIDSAGGLRHPLDIIWLTDDAVKELCLDMSDFNQSSHDFKTFVEKLTILGAGKNKSKDTHEEEGILQFEDTLFFVHLPDLNYVKQPCSHTTLQTLFVWLKDTKQVKTIKKLNIPDNTINPINPAFFELNILNKFTIEALDWRKLDMSLDILTGGADARKPPKEPGIWNSLKELKLYSSGNWSVLYHWISKDGLARLSEVRSNADFYNWNKVTDVSSFVMQLRNVRIEIVQLDPAEGAHDENVRDRHLELAKQYKAHLEHLHDENRKAYQDEKTNSGLNFRYDLAIKVDAKWYYPPPPHEPEDATTHVPIHHFTGQLGPCHTFLDDEGERNTDPTASDRFTSDEAIEAQQDDKNMQHLQRLQMYTRTPIRDFYGSFDDRRIKVAIIDNGADRIRSRIGEMIAKGVSYVTADVLGSDRILPWWMVSDAHGTQMASLIGQANPYCRLYIARVGKGRKDIDTTSAAKAVRWAVEQKVDIISMSWTTTKDDPDLQKAIQIATSNGTNGRPTLVFCSTADEGLYSEKVYPVDYGKVVSVSATDRWGHSTSKTRRDHGVDIQIPGDNIEAVGPAYIGTVTPTVSGSSVATALAAGIASLALLLIRTYNDLEDEDMRPFYTREGILRVFKKMDADKGGIQLGKLFPRERAKDTCEILAKNWVVENFPEER